LSPKAALALLDQILSHDAVELLGDAGPQFLASLEFSSHVTNDEGHLIPDSFGDKIGVMLRFT
jgi:hypothetical protein